MKSFSVVVPVYKVEEYLERCVESIIQQDYDQNLVEIILVDDGSPDRCGKICDGYAEKYYNVKVYHKSNGGLSDARNYGLERSSKDYVMFVDSDDYIEMDACRKFSEALEKNKFEADICTGGFISHSGSGEQLSNTDNDPDTIMNGRDYLKYRLQSNHFIANAWASVYNREFLLQNKLFFCKDRLHEDEEFTPRAFLKAQTVMCNTNIFYHYIIRENSITTSKNKTKNAIDIFLTAESLFEIYQNIEDEVLKKLLMSHSAKICFKAIEEGKLYRKKDRHLIAYSVIKENCQFSKEKVRYYLLKTNPWITHTLLWLQRSLFR